MLIDSKMLPEFIEEINHEPCLAIDTETTGLEPYKEDYLFAITISTAKHDYYLDFNQNQNNLCTLPYEEIAGLIKPDYKGTIFMHNAGFDLRFLAREGLRLDHHDVHCTMSMGRLIYNNEFRYTLDALSKKYLGNTGKDDGVAQYIKAHKCYTMERRPGKKKADKRPHFDQVPLEIMQPYAERDTRLTYDLGIHQKNFLERFDQLRNLYQNEKKLTGVFFRMDDTGTFTDYEFTHRAAIHEAKKVGAVVAEWKEKTGIDFKDHWSCFAAAYKKFGFDYAKTEKGNPCFKDDVIKHQRHDLAHMIREYRKHYNRMNTYDSLNHFSSEESVVHPYSKQSGCTTGRVSYSDPPVQCMEKAKKSEEEFLIRRSFCPRPGHSFFMLDYDQMEYRMLLNLAGQMDLIEEVQGGKDVHTATADSQGVDRDTAKTLNFAIVYGSGPDTIAEMLDVSPMEARELRQNYFRSMPEVKRFLDECTWEAASNGFITNWFGRRCYIHPDYCYKAPNYKIQGGCADWIKQAMVNIDKFLHNTPDIMIKLLLQVHDELVFEVKDGHQDWIHSIKHLMENVTNAAPHDKLKYTVGIEWSKQSWQDKDEWHDKENRGT